MNDFININSIFQLVSTNIKNCNNLGLYCLVNFGNISYNFIVYVNNFLDQKECDKLNT